MILAPIMFVTATTVSDFIGRRKTIIAMTGFYFLCFALGLLTDNYTSKLIFFGLIKNFDVGFYSLIIMGGMESIDDTNPYKFKIDIITYLWNAVGALFLAAVTLKIHDIQSLTILFFVVIIICCLPICFVYLDTVKYYLKKGEISDAIEQVKMIF